MIDEGKLREKLGKILERPAYGSLHTFAREPLIDRIIEAVKASKKTLPKPKPEPSEKRKKSG